MWRVAHVDAGGKAPGVAARNASLGDGPQIGKRYAEDKAGVELLFSRAGAGALTVDGRLVPMKGAKPLPSSD